MQDFQQVKQGDLIARIDDRIFRQKLAQAEAGLEAAHAAFAVAEQNVRSAEAVRTMAKLARSGEASISIDALADLIRVALDSHLPIPEAVATHSSPPSSAARRVWKALTVGLVKRE